MESKLKTNKIKAVMVENGDNQKDLAKKLGIADASLSEKFNKKQPFKVSELEKIAEIYGCSVALFF